MFNRFAQLAGCKINFIHIIQLVKGNFVCHYFRQEQLHYGDRQLVYVICRTQKETSMFI